MKAFGGASLKFLAQLTIKVKIILVVLIPILAFFYKLSVNIAHENQRLEELSQVAVLADLSYHVSAVVHEWQKERGMTAGYMGSKGQKFIEALPKQRKLADEKMFVLKDFLNAVDLDQFPNKFNDLLSQAFSQNNERESIRKAVTGLSMPKGNAIGYYTNVNALFLNLVGYASSLSTDSMVSSGMAAYYNFLLSKERAGIERAVLTGAFAAKGFSPASYTKFSKLVSAQSSFMESFNNLSSVRQKTLVTADFDHPAFRAVEKLREGAYAINLTKNATFPMSPEDCFQTLTSRIEVLKKMDVKIAKDLSLLTSELIAVAEAIIWEDIIVSVIIFLIILISFLVMSKAITDPIIHSAMALEEISEGEGDLRQRLEVMAGIKTETSRLCYFFNNFAQRIQDVIGEVKSVNIKLNTASDSGIMVSQTMNTTASQLLQESSSVSASLDQLAGNMQGISGAGEEVSSLMRNISASVTEMASTVSEMARQCSESASQAESSNEKSSESAHVMTELTTAAEKIGNVVVTISDIADKTDLLALNATIEAASAGEAGKGFAVVASEIKELSKQTQGATGEISNLVKSIREKSEQASTTSVEVSSSIEELKLTIDGIAAGVEEMSVTAQEIDSNIGSASNEVIGISDKIKEAFTGTEEISGSFKTVRELASETSDVSGQAEDNAKALKATAKNLDQKVELFIV